MKQTKRTYVSPQIEVIALENEGVIAGSLVQDAGGYEPAPWSSSTRSFGASQSATSNDIEEMIEDLFQVNN